MLKSLRRSIKNLTNGYSSVQVLVRNATSNEPSGPSTYEMEEIGNTTYQSQTEFLEVMDMLDRRLNDKGKNWRHVAKSLTVLDYLVRYGSEKCVLWSKDNLYIIKTLREFIHFDEAGVDQGAIVRVKAKELVSLLIDDERIQQEREAAGRSLGGRPGRRNGLSPPPRRRRNTADDDDYDPELERALELSKLTAREESNRPKENDDDLKAALRLSMEEEEMRKARNNQNSNLLDLQDDNEVQYMQPQYYAATGLVQQPQFTYAQPVQTNYDMFGDIGQNPMAAGVYNPYDQQIDPNQLAQQQGQTTSFNYQPDQQPTQGLHPLKTGSNNPFALPSSDENGQAGQTLMDMSQKKQQEEQQRLLQQQQELLRQQELKRQQEMLRQQEMFRQQELLRQQTSNNYKNLFANSLGQQPTQLKPQSTSSSRYNDSTHSELNNLLAQGTGVDTFGNTGATRIPHQHTRTQLFINSSGTGFKQVPSEPPRLSSNATGNPFLNTGVGYQNQMNSNHTGYGFGNVNPSQYHEPKSNDGPSLIDI